MKNKLLLLAFFISFAIFSQQKAIEITNIKSGKTKVFEENQRIKIITLDGKKYIGNLQFTDNQTLLINNQSIKMDSLQSIKKQPKTTFGTIKKVLFFTGLATIGASVVAASTGNDSAFLFFAVGSGVTISAGLLEGRLNTKRKWNFVIIEK